VDKTPSDPRLRLYRFVFEHAPDATVVFDADGRPILLNRTARELPDAFVEGLFAQDAPHAALLVSFRDEVAEHGHAQAQVPMGARRLQVYGRAYGAQIVVTIREG
jgi:PAS domain-containing protein